MKTPITYTLLLFILFNSCKSNKQNNDIWISQGFFHNNVIDDSGKFILDLDDNVLYDFNKNKFVDSLDVEKRISYNLKNPYNYLDSVSISDKRVYQSQLDGICHLVFKKVSDKKSNRSLLKLLNRNWTRTIKNTTESFLIQEDYELKSPISKIIRKYFLNDTVVFIENEKFALDTLTYKGFQFLFLRSGNFVSLNQIAQNSREKLELIQFNSFNGNKVEFNNNESFNGLTGKDFEVCNENKIAEYYYNGMGNRNIRNKQEILSYFLKNYNYPSDSNVNGYIRFRFVVNCKGDIGRFSLQEMDRNFKPKKFPHDLTQQLFNSILDIGGWLPKKWGPQYSVDYNIHIGFKIKNGQIDEILP